MYLSTIQKQRTMQLISMLKNVTCLYIQKLGVCPMLLCLFFIPDDLAGVIFTFLPSYYNMIVVKIEIKYIVANVIAVTGICI